MEILTRCPETVIEIQKYYDSGYGLHECSLKYGIPLISWAKRHGLKTRQKRQSTAITRRRRLLERLEIENLKDRICEYCGNDFKTVFIPGQEGTGRFCRLKCARAFSTKDKKKEIKIKVAIKRAKSVHPLFELRCPCGKVKQIPWCHRVRRKYCSVSCARKFPTDETRKKLSDRAKHLIREGKMKSWLSRSSRRPSYAEQFFINLFNSNKIEFKREYQVGRVFIDFAFIENKRALEIDGKQHQWPERKAKDIKKDAFLISEGWKVKRIPWVHHSQFDKSKIPEFLESIKKFISG